MPRLKIRGNIAYLRFRFSPYGVVMIKNRCKFVFKFSSFKGDVAVIHLNNILIKIR
jgi:hypothetical protein